MAMYTNRVVRCSKTNPFFTVLSRNFGNNSSARKWYQHPTVRYICLVSGGLLAFTAATYRNRPKVYALQLRKDEIADKAIKLTARERRFIKFASVEFDGQIYMTPQDFLESVVEQEPRPRLKRKSLTHAEIQQLKDYTPPLKHGSSQLFRSLRDKGIISYTEYLFLLSVLTKPHSGFRIAFNMFDTDGNQRVDKDEFLVLLHLVSTSAQARFLLKNDNEQKSQTSVAEQRKPGTRDDGNVGERKPPTPPPVKGVTARLMEKIFSFAWKGKRGIESKEGEEPGEHDDYVDDEQGLQRKHKVDTTLQIHFFGKKGDKDLQYDGFYNFMKNLQTEVLELEFCEFSKGHERISEVDFAKILLRYTYLDTDEYDNYLDRLLDREAKEKGVSFDEFRQFCQFLNNLDDFSIAMRMYTLADQPISKDEFSRAVKICTGSELNSHLIDTVFAIFDEDGDGLLSYKEFIAIMKDRVHRGFKVSHYEHIVEDYLDDIEKGTVYADNFRQLLKMRSRACRRLRRYLLYFYYHPDHGQSDSTRHYR
ncbi:calcium uptake protein 3, mitochondrial isoform X2 [Anopheles gambiae]|uniref:calcium uptake protein 3, mitochondrial isoform X2 n=1 Tax=Anopheles coluzzii TaxID=1518534 RepID=UPI0020FFC7DA|nr:calcium uptake protein 3, mitochondrial isoform X2 [Anopheles coluzzii]XP_061506212.1 calcium uptake protein 3, mitochondrial isoform X2 [Anopheles gambiae]